MESSEDKQWASKYLLDPLTAPEPSQETGPGTHHNLTASSNAPSRPASTASHNTNVTSKSSRKPLPTTSRNTASPSSNVDRPLSTATASTGNRNHTVRSRHISSGSSSRNSYPSPSASVHLQQSQAPHRRGPVPSFDQHSSHRSSSEIPTSSTGRRRNSSLLSRFDGDESHRPLDIIKRDTKLAHRAPHLRKKHHIGPDTIDNLDVVGGGYHHEGPYDATLLAKNTSSKSSPLEAVRDTNIEALKATPREMIQDSIQKHRPLDGVAIVPPGIADRYGRTYHYEEGTDMMIENGGDYKRWAGVEYLPEDLKGKGEPSYSLEKAIKEHKLQSRRRAISDGHASVEMRTHATAPSTSSDLDASQSLVGQEQRYADWEGQLRRNSTGRRGGGGLRKRLGTLKII